MKLDNDNLKRVRCSYKGRTEYIPEIWLAGRSRMRQQQGLTVADAYTQAIADWFEQSDLALEYERQQQKAAVDTDIETSHKMYRKMDRQTPIHVHTCMFCGESGTVITNQTGGGE